MVVNTCAVTTEAARRRALIQITLLSLAFVVLVAIAAASLYWLQKAREDNAWVAHTLEVQNQIALAQLQLRRAESAERGYVLTRQDDLIAQFEEAASDVVPRLKRLRDFVADNYLV